MQVRRRESEASFDRECDGSGARRVAGSPVHRRHVGNASEFAVCLGWTEPHGTSHMILFSKLSKLTGFFFTFFLR